MGSLNQRVDEPRQTWLARTEWLSSPHDQTLLSAHVRSSLMPRWCLVYAESDRAAEAHAWEHISARFCSTGLVYAAWLKSSNDVQV